MARARNIKPSIFQNEVLGTADPLLTILFASLWTLADREGRLEDRPMRIKASTFPYREGVDIEQLLTWLHDHEFIERYETKGTKCVQICNFLKHQRPHPNEPMSDLPSNQRSQKVRSTSTNGASASNQNPSHSRLLIESLLIESPTPIPFASDHFRETLFKWAQHRTEKRNPLTETSIRQQLKKLAAWGESRAIAAIEQSITNGWVGLFEPRSDVPRKMQSNREEDLMREIQQAGGQ